MSIDTTLRQYCETCAEATVTVSCRLFGPPEMCCSQCCCWPGRIRDDD